LRVDTLSITHERPAFKAPMEATCDIRAQQMGRMVSWCTFSNWE
jgi:hypothetical protein